MRLRDLASASPREAAVAAGALPDYSSDDSSDSSDAGREAPSDSDESSDDDIRGSRDVGAEPAWTAAGELQTSLSVRHCSRWNRQSGRLWGCLADFSLS